MPAIVLNRLELAGPYRENSPERLAALAGEAGELGYAVRCWILTGKPAEDLAGLGEMLDFPACFGGNFDALYDCLCDTAVLSLPGLFLRVEQADQWPEEARDTLIAVFQAVADEWREQGRAFWVLFAAPKLDLETLPG